MHDFHYVGSSLYCERVALDSLAERFGTPLYIYSQHTLTDHFEKLQRALGSLDHLICYAIKANSNAAILRVLANQGGGFDVVSEGELRRVIAAGGDPRKCVFAGVGKTEGEIRFALEHDIYCLNVESEPELARINRIARAMKKQAPVAVRVNPNIDAGTTCAWSWTARATNRKPEKFRSMKPTVAGSSSCRMTNRPSRPSSSKCSSSEATACRVKSSTFPCNSTTAARLSFRSKAIRSLPPAAACTNAL
jgi:hypothetical protein